MALDFPSGASMGSVYTGTNGTVYVYDGVKWRISSSVNDLVPTSGGTYDLGSTSTTWNSLYVNRVFIRSTATANSTGSGALQVVGGAGIGGNLYVGSNIYLGEVPVNVNTSGQLTVNGITVNPFNAQNDITLPNKFPIAFTATFDSIHYAGTGTFVGDGTVSLNWEIVRIGDTQYSLLSDDPSFNSNRGYITTQTFNFTELDHGITGYVITATLALIDGGGGTYATQLGVSPAPGVADLGQIRSNQNIAIKAGNKGWLLDTNGNLYLPTAGTIRDSAGNNLLAGEATTSTLVNGTYTLQLLVGGDLTLPGEIHGKQLYGFSGTPNGRAVNITPADDASDKKFKFRVDQYGETFTRAYLDMPTAQNNKQVAISFAHENNTVGYIFNQGADTFDDGLNNAFNIFYNAGDIKLTAMTTGTGVFKTWKFGQNGGLTSPDGSTSTGASVYVPYATSSSYKITTELDMLGSYLPQTFEVIGDRIKLPNRNGLIQSGDLVDAWSLDSLNKSFTFPNQSDIEYGDGTYLSTGSLRVRVDFGGEFSIFLNEPNKTWTFNNSGNIVFPDSTVQTTAYTGPQTTLVGVIDNNVLIRTSETVVTNNIYTNTTDFVTDIDPSLGFVISGWQQRTETEIELNLFVPGLGSFYTFLTGLALGRTVVVTYSTSGSNQTFTSTLTQVFSAIAQFDPVTGWQRTTGRILGTLPVDQTGIVSVNFPVTTTPQRDWTFSDTGSLTFPDGTTQTTAFVSGGISSYTPTNVGNWIGTPTVATVSAALDELAQRTTTVESIAGVTGTNVTNVFMFNSNGSYSMTQNVEYKIPFDTVSTGHDNGDFQTTSSQFIPQIAGWYLLETHLNFGGVWSGNVNVSVYKNNNQEKLIGTSWVGNGGGVGGSAFVYSNGTTDIFEIRATQTSGGVQALEHGATKTWFQATWMKP